MKCAVANCNSSNDNKACNISFFVFPANNVLKKKWVSFCRRENKFNPKSSFICMLHFKPEDIENGLQYDMGFAKYRLLKRDVVPTVNSHSIGNVELSTQRTSRIEKRENKKIVNSLLNKSYADDAAKRLQEVEVNKAADGSSGCFDTFETWTEKIETEDVEIQAPSNESAMLENENGLIVKNEKDDTDAKTIVSNVVNCPQNTIVAHANDHSLEAADSTMSEIKSVEEALEHLRLLEEFAMLQDNYRAIGLLTQLEQLFKQSAKEEGECKIIN